MNAKRNSKRVTLQVFVAAHCWQCPEARALAREMQNEFAALDVRVIDLDEPGAAKPAKVFAVPTFLLDDRIVSLGTPSRDALHRQIIRTMERRDG
jgi:hypothetical protein